MKSELWSVLDSKRSCKFDGLIVTAMISCATIIYKDTYVCRIHNSLLTPTPLNIE